MGEKIQNWEAEIIPNKDFLFRNVHQNYIAVDQPNVIPPGNFQEHNHGISMDWDKYSSAEECRQTAKEPDLNGVITINVGKIRGLESLEVQHEPKPSNRAHTNIHRLNNLRPQRKTKIRLKLSEFSSWVINPFMN